jgi:hypothetical protein
MHATLASHTFALEGLVLVHTPLGAEGEHEARRRSSGRRGPGFELDYLLETGLAPARIEPATDAPDSQEATMNTPAGIIETAWASSTRARSSFEYFPS